MKITASSNYKGWRSVPISSVVFFQEGPGVRKHQYKSSGVKLLNGGNINDGILSLDSTDRYISEEEAFGKYEHFLVEEGDLLIACSGVVVDKFDGKIAYAKKEHLPLCMNTSTMRFRTLDQNILEIDYFRRFLASNLFKNQLQKLITGSAQLNFGPSHIKQMFVPLPPLPEQKRIAAILDKADSLRRKNQQAIQLADKFLRAVFLDMFGDPVTNPKGWQKYPIDNVGRVITGSTPPSTKDGMFGSEIPFVTPGDLDSNLETVNRWLSLEGRNFSRICRAGSLMACCIGATIGKVGIANSESAFNQQINVVEWTNLVDDMFGYYLFKMNPSFITENAIKTTLPILKKSLFEKIEIPVPPIHLQKQYSEKALAVKKILVKLSKTPDLMLFNSLSQKAFAGKL